MTFICTVCGKDTKTKDTKGSMKHPICVKCYKDREKRGIWMNQLERYHPDLHEMYKEIFKAKK